MWTPQGRQGSKLRTVAHDVDALEIVRAVFLEDRRPLHGVFVRPGRSVYIAGAGVPGRGRVGMIVGDLAVANHQVMRQRPAHRLMKTAADADLRHLEFAASLGPSGVHFAQPLLDEIAGCRCGIRLEITSWPDRARSYCSRPESSTRIRSRAARPSWADGSSRCGRWLGRSPSRPCRPAPSPTAAPAGRRPYRAPGSGRLWIVPTRRHHPGVFALKVALLRAGLGGLIPGMQAIDRIT